MRQIDSERGLLEGFVDSHAGHGRHGMMKEKGIWQISESVSSWSATI